MRKIVIFPIICLLLLTSCFNKKEDKINLVLRPALANLVDSFIELNHPIHVELHINKITPHYILMLLYGGDSPLTQQSEIWNTKINGKDVAIYTGMENMIELNKNINHSNIVDTNKTKQGHYWILRELRNKINITRANANVSSPFKAIPPFITPEELTVEYVVDSICPL